MTTDTTKLESEILDHIGVKLTSSEVTQSELMTMLMNVATSLTFSGISTAANVTNRDIELVAEEVLTEMRRLVTNYLKNPQHDGIFTDGVKIEIGTIQ